MTSRMMGDPERSSRTSRMLLIAGAVVGVISVITWVSFDSGGNGGTPTGQCRVPAHATSGTQTPPALVSQLAAPIGPPNVTATLTSGGSSVYVYCYDLIDGAQLIAAIGALREDGYSQAAGDDPTTQVSFTQDGKSPYGINLTVNGELVVDHPNAQTHGGLSITWTDGKPPDQ
ncbi:MAG: hypothetical protein ACRDWT_01120 [Jatrophihabitantaceae bacterium]